MKSLITKGMSPKMRHIPVCARISSCMSMYSLTIYREQFIRLEIMKSNRQYFVKSRFQYQSCMNGRSVIGTEHILNFNAGLPVKLRLLISSFTLLV